MSFVIAAPDLMAAAATDLAGIGSAVTAANAAAAAPTASVVAAAADEVSVAVAALFGAYGQSYQALSAEAVTFQDQFVRTLTASAGSYAAADAAIANLLQAVGYEVLRVINAPTQALFGRTLIPYGANGVPGTGAVGGAGGISGNGNGGFGAPQALAFGGQTALVMGPSGVPVPPQTYVDAANNLFLNLPASSVQALTTPQGLYPITGVNTLRFGASVALGQATLHNAIMYQLALGNHVEVFGYSQSSAIASLEMSRLAAAGVPSDAVSFTLVGNITNPNGGLLVRFAGSSVPSFGLTTLGATPSNLYPTSIYTNEYDGFADFPRYPINLLSVLNAYAGIIFQHTTYLDPTAGSQTINLGTYDQTTYYMTPAERLPLLEPLRWLPFGNPLASLIEPSLRVGVNLGYGSTTQGWDPGPPNVPTPFGLFPTHISPGEVFTALANGIPEGITQANQDIAMGRLSDTTSLYQLFEVLHTYGLTPSDQPTLMQLLAAGATYGNGGVPVTPINWSSPNSIVNGLTSVTSSNFALVLPLADTALAVAITPPQFAATLFVDNLASGDLLGAVGDPIAAGIGIAPLLVLMQAGVIGEALATTTYTLLGGVVP